MNIPSADKKQQQQQQQQQQWLLLTVRLSQREKYVRYGGECIDMVVRARTRSNRRENDVKTRPE